MKTVTTLTLLALCLMPSCSRGVELLPKVGCGAKPGSRHAAFCARTVAMNLGPADQFTGYSNVRGQVLAIMREDAAASILPDVLGRRRTFILDMAELVRNEEVAAHTSGPDGGVSFRADPGSYVVCTQSKRRVREDQPILSCEVVDLRRDSAYRLLIVDNPRAGMQFIRQDRE